MKHLMIALAAMAVATPAFAEHHEGHDDMTIEQKVDMKFEKYDTNRDGSLSESELSEWKEFKWDDADTNEDGKITKAEMTAWKHAKHAD